MKKTINLTRKRSAFFLLTLIILTAVVYSCKKDLHNNNQQDISDPTVAQAKSWYESTYPAKNSNLNTQATTSNGDLSQLIKPDWQHSSTYTRFNKQVIEMPLDPSSKFSSSFKNMTTGLGTNVAYSQSSFILLNDGSKQSAYVMTLIADSSYIKNNPDKLKNNKYNKRDADYSGLLLYFTPKGKYIRGYRYVNGQIVQPSSTNSPSGNKTLNVNSSKLKPMTNAPLECWDYYLVYYTNGREDSQQYLFTWCSGGDGGGGTNGSLTGGNGGGSSPSTTAPPAPPTEDCDDTPTTGMESVHIVLNGNTSAGPQPTDPYNPSNPTNPTNPNDPKPGFPPPDDSGGTPCNVAITIPVQDIRDSINAKYPCARNLIAQLVTLNSDIARILYQAFGSTNGASITFLDGNAADFPAGSKEDGNTVGYRIQINPFVLSNSTNEYRLVTFYHEAIHAFLNMERERLGSNGFSTKYPEIRVQAQPNGSGNVNDRYNYTIDEGTTVGKVDKDPQHRTMAEYFTDNLRDAILAYNPQFPRDRATALARYGLFDDTSITNFNNAERDVSKAEFAGTKCTP